MDPVIGGPPCFIDIVLVLDVSSSIPKDQFVLARDFMMYFVECAEFQGLAIRIGVICYNCEAKTYFDLTPIAQGMEYKIHYITYKGGETRTGHAIYYMNCTSNWRQESHPAAVILTDGRSNDDELDEAVKARAAGIDLYAVGFGYPLLVDWTALDIMTGDITGSRVFTASQACDLAQKIVADQCGE
ncbi:matrilin-2-like [Branchiostoma floridae]|uniref:Matrilin-2-like n=1 Tax=Branchiostoma floridae TaxID=7739 RepID=A0A9J7HJV1_BRAFL|nr:matrilin-2-like [Branchiostoma floridae]